MDDFDVFGIGFDPMFNGQVESMTGASNQCNYRFFLWFTIYCAVIAYKRDNVVQGFVIVM